MRPLLLVVTLLPGCFLTDDVDTDSGGGSGDVREIDHGTLASEDGQVLFPVDVEDGDTSFLFQCTGSDVLSLDQILDPDGNVALDWQDWNGDYGLTNAFFPCSSDGCVTDFAANWPVRDEDGPLTPGTWTVVVDVTDESFNFVDGDVDGTTLVKSDADMGTSVVPVSIVYADGVDDNQDVVDAIEAAVDHWQQIWEPYGLSVSARYSSSDIGPHLDFPSSNNPSMEAASELSEPWEITLLIGEDIDGGVEWLGFSSGIPGALVPGPRTGVEVGWLGGSGTDAEFTDEEIEIMAGTFAHEVGHFQGLRHPVESSYDLWDALDDTPECSNQSGCEDKLGNNLMFPYTVLGIGPQEDMTGGQVGIVMLYAGSP